MGTDVYTLRKGKGRRLVLDDGTKVMLYPFVWAFRPCWGNYRAESYERLVAGKAAKTWEDVMDVHHCYSDIEDGVYVNVIAKIDPVWHDSAGQQGDFQGIYRSKGKRLVPPTEYAYESVVLPLGRHLHEMKGRIALGLEEQDERVTEALQILEELDHEQGPSRWGYHRRLLDTVDNAVLLYEATSLAMSHLQVRYIRNNCVYVPNSDTEEGRQYRALEQMCGFSTAWRSVSWRASVDGQHYKLLVQNPDSGGNTSIWLRDLASSNVIPVPKLIASDGDTFVLPCGRVLQNPDVVLDGAMLQLDDEDLHRVRMLAVMGAPDGLEKKMRESV